MYSTPTPSHRRIRKYSSYSDVLVRDVKFGIQIGPGWPQIGQIWDILRSILVHLSSARKNVPKLILKSPRFVPFGVNLIQHSQNVRKLILKSPRYLSNLGPIWINSMPSLTSQEEDTQEMSASVSSLRSEEPGTYRPRHHSLQPNISSHDHLSLWHVTTSCDVIAGHRELWRHCDVAEIEIFW